jgi:methyl-accepting chemotaxis protein
LPRSRQPTHTSNVAGPATEEARATDGEIAGPPPARKIGEAVKLNPHIAGQTNLLALNVPIEVARRRSRQGLRGGRGRGQTLAVQTAKATEEIASHISQWDSTTGAVDAIRQIAGRMEINQYTPPAAGDSVEQQNSLPKKSGYNVARAADGTSHVWQRYGEVAVLRPKRAHRRKSCDVSQSAESAVANLRLEVERFSPRSQLRLSPRTKLG